MPLSAMIFAATSTLSPGETLISFFLPADAEVLAGFDPLATTRETSPSVMMPTGESPSTMTSEPIFHLAMAFAAAFIEESAPNVLTFLLITSLT